MRPSTFLTSWFRSATWAGLALLLMSCGPSDSVGADDPPEAVSVPDVVERTASPPAEAPPAEAPSIAKTPAAKPVPQPAETRAPGPATSPTPPAPSKAASQTKRDLPRDDIPWLEGAALIELKEMTDLEHPDVPSSKIIFEIAKTPDKVFDLYVAALERAGWSVQPIPEAMILGTKGKTMLMATLEPGTGHTRLNVFVGAKPPTKE